MVLNFHGEFAEILNNKNDKRYKIWRQHAVIQLKLKECDKFAPYITADDVIFDIITGVLTGHIKWNKERVKNITTFMFNQIRGYVSNLKVIELNRESLYMSCYDTLPLPSRKKYNEENMDTDELSGTSLEQIQKIQNYTESYETICEALKDDNIANLVFEDMVNGYENKETARRYKISVSEVVNAKKRLQRVIRRLKDNGEI